MSGPRFARTGRCRFFVCLGLLVLMFGMIAVFHSSQRQLDETREQRLRCEQQQEALSERLENVAEQKYQLEKSREREASEYAESRKHLEQKLKETLEADNKEQVEASARYEKLQQSYKLLQSEHSGLKADCAKSKKQHLEDINGMEKKIQSLTSQVQREKNSQDQELALWKQKHDAAVREKDRLELLLQSANSHTKLLTRIRDLEKNLTECETRCKHTSTPPHKTSTSPSSRQFDKPRLQKSFSEQSAVSPGLYKIPILAKPIEKVVENAPEQHKQPESLEPPVAAALVDGSKIAPPLSAPRKQTSTQSSKSANLHGPESNAYLKQAANVSSTSSSSNLPPLPVPPNAQQQQRKLPDNVAPIPANFDELIKNDASAQKEQHKQRLGSLVDAAGETGQRHANDAGNNRYANAMNDMEPNKAHKVASNGDSGAHEIKDAEQMNEQNFNLPEEDDNNFFDGAAKNDAVADEKHKADNEDDDMMGAVGAGDIAVKNNNHLLDTDDLNNEVAGDQGKEFPDGLRLEEPDEDGDEDDYSNPAARQQGAQAIRN